MITPDYLNEIVEATEATVRKVQATILNKICKRIIASFNAGQENIIIPSSITQMHQLMDLGMTQEEIQNYIEKALPEIEEEVRKAFLISAKEISDYNTDIAKEIIKKEEYDIEIPKYEEVGLPKSASQLNMTVAEIRALEQMYRSTLGTIRNLCMTMPQSGMDAYINACDDALAKINSGMSPNTAIIDAIHQVSTDGLKVIQYKSGMQTSPEVAISRAVRSGINKSNSEIVLYRCCEMGVSAVLVSQHFGARVTKKMDYTNHAHWQGKVYSLNTSRAELLKYSVDSPGDDFKWLRELKEYNLSKKESGKYPDFIDECGYGNIQGIAGVNCRHSFSPFYPDVMKEPNLQYDYEENEKRYEMEQYQRRLERKVRDTKQELLNLSDMQGEEADEMKKYLKNKLKDREKALLDYCKDNNLKVQNFRTEVAVGK